MWLCHVEICKDRMQRGSGGNDEAHSGRGAGVVRAARLRAWASGGADFDAASARTWPSGPIRWLVGFPPGGTADMISRDIAARLEKVLGAADRHREPARRERLDRDRRAGRRQARRADADDDPVGPHHQCVPLSESRLRSAEGRDAGQPGRVLAARDRGEPELSRLRHQVAGRGREGEARHDLVRDAGRRLDPATCRSS